MIKLSNIGCNQVRNRKLVFLQICIVAELAKLSARNLLERHSVILHVRHLQSRAVAFQFHEDHFIQDEIRNNSRTWVHWHRLPHEEVLLLLVIEVLVVAVNHAKLERLNAGGGERARILILLEAAILVALDQVVISIGVSILRDVHVSDRFSQLLIRAYLNFVDDRLLF